MPNADPNLRGTQRLANTVMAGAVVSLLAFAVIGVASLARLVF